MENKIYEKGSFGQFKEQAKKDGFDSIRDWQKWKRYRNIKNIDQVENILEENNIEIKDLEIFYRFWSKVDIKDNVKDCWNWIVSTNRKGYGIFSHDKEQLSHRIAYILTKGSISDNLQVQHFCNNSLCCNPYHLELGNQSKNMQYMIKCKRQRYVGTPILTEDQVREIHKIYNEQRRLHPEFRRRLRKIKEPITKKFGISMSHITGIISGDRWTHIYKEFH